VTGLPPFFEVVAGHGPTVLRVCRAVAGPVDADDAWSEAFIAALRAYPSLPADTNVEAWLVTIACRKAIDQVRRARRRPSPLAEIRAGAVLPAGDPAPGDVAGMLVGLTERQRLAVVYHHLGGRPYATVADLMGTSPAAARRAAADGIAKLRRARARAAGRAEGGA
jgi:DNA-directed RNA polymerase specialized sigma24 family protein